MPEIQRTIGQRVVRTSVQDIRVVKREGQGDDDMCVEGYAVKWADQYDTTYFSEKIAKGAFAQSLSARAVAVLNGHQRHIVVGSTRSGTTLVEDDTGLRFSSPFNKSMASRDLYAMVEANDVPGVSVGMSIMDELRKNGEGASGKDLYIVMRADLHEFSMTAFPAYEQTEVEARYDEQLTQRRKALASQVSPETRQRLYGLAVATGKYRAMSRNQLEDSK